MSNEIRVNTLQRVRKLPPSAGMLPFASAQAAVSGDAPAAAEIDYGWTMRAGVADDAALEDFFSPRREPEGYAPVSVPQSLFFDDVVAKLPAPEPGAEVIRPALYYRNWFTLSELREDKQYVLRFMGFAPFGELYVNGVFVADISDGFGPCEFDISGLLRCGSNLIAARAHTGPALAKPWDARRPFGIFRPVFLEIRSLNRVTDLEVKTRLLDDGMALVKVNISLLCEDIEPGCQGIVTLATHDKDGEIVTSRTVPVDLVRGRLTTVPLTSEIFTPALWSAETPTVYRSVVELKLSDGAPGDIRAVDFALARTDIESVQEGDAPAGCLMHNQKPLKIRGAVYFAYGGDDGYNKPETTIEYELARLKEHGFNTIRLLAPDDKVLALCNRLGIYVICECSLNVEKLRLTKKQRAENDPLKFALLRLAAMVSAFRSYPCIIMWSLGDCPVYARATLANLLASIDDTRPLVCDGDYTFAVSDVFAAIDCSAADLYAVAQGKPVRGGLLFTLAYRPQPFLLLGAKPAFSGENTVAEQTLLISNSARLAGAVYEVEDINDDALLARFTDGFNGIAAQVEQPSEAAETAMAAEE